MTSDRLKRLARDGAMVVLGGGLACLAGFARPGGAPEESLAAATAQQVREQTRASTEASRPASHASQAPGTPLAPKPSAGSGATVASEPRPAQAPSAPVVAAPEGKAPAPVAAAAATASGEPPAPKRSPFDLTKGEWQEQAQKGAVKFRMPCQRPKGWAPEDADLQALGLDLATKPAIREAYRLSNERVFRSVADVCGATIGDVRVAERILANQRMGLTACVSLVLEDDFKRDPGRAEVSLRAVAELQAGSAQAASVEPTLTPTGKLMLALAREAGAFEADLARLLTPELAERIVHDDSLNSYRGQKPVCLYGDAYSAEALRHQAGW